MIWSSRKYFLCLGTSNKMKENVLKVKKIPLVYSSAF